MDEDDKEFQCDFTTEDESLLIQLATDAEASQHVASAIDALPARSDFVSGVAKHDDVATEKPEQAVSTAEDSPAARATPLPTSAEAGSPTRTSTCACCAAPFVKLADPQATSEAAT